MNTVKTILGIGLLSAVLVFGMGQVKGSETIEIKVSPNVVNIESESSWVTVHTDISYSSFISDQATITLDGIEVAWTKSDLQGDLVAKFDALEVKDYLKTKVGQEVELVFYYDLGDGDVRTGSSILKVIDVAGR